MLDGMKGSRTMSHFGLFGNPDPRQLEGAMLLVRQKCRGYVAKVSVVPVWGYIFGTLRV
jgi:hypothetical protein